MYSLLGKVVSGMSRSSGLWTENWCAQDDSAADVTCFFQDEFACFGGGVQPCDAEPVGDGLSAELSDTEDELEAGHEVGPVADCVLSVALKENLEKGQFASSIGSNSFACEAAEAAFAQGGTLVPLQEPFGEEGRLPREAVAVGRLDGQIRYADISGVHVVAPAQLPKMEMLGNRDTSVAAGATLDRLNLSCLIFPQPEAAESRSVSVGVVSPIADNIRRLEPVQALRRASVYRVSELPTWPLQDLGLNLTGMEKSMPLEGPRVDSGGAPSSYPSALFMNSSSVSGALGEPVVMSLVQSALLRGEEKNISGDSRFSAVDDVSNVGHLAMGQSATLFDARWNAPQVSEDIRGLNLAVLNFSRKMAETGRSERSLAITTDLLGEIRLRLAVEDGRIAVIFAAERHEGLEAVKRNLPLLTEGLREAGYIKISYDFEGHQGGVPERTRDMREALEGGGENEGSVVQDTVRVMLRDGLDLRI